VTVPDPQEGWELAYSMRLPEPTVLLNKWQRMHYWRRSGYKGRLQWLVREAHGVVPSQPLARCAIHVTRGNPKPFPDEDGLIGGLKPLIDVLSGFHPKVNPHGLGFILNDATTCLERLTAEPVQTQPRHGFTLVEIYQPAALQRKKATA